MAKDQNEDVIVDIEEVYSKSEQFLETYKKQIIGVIAVLVIGIGGFFAYDNLVVVPNNKEAQELMWKAEYYFEIDSLDKAINGDNNYVGFAEIAENYGSTKAGNLAKYYLGVCYLNKGEFQLAIDNLKDANLEDEVVSSVALGSIGDAYVEIGDVDKAVSYFGKAANNSDNNLTAPLYLKKKAIALESLNKYKDALAAYETIKADFPKSNEAQDIEKYIAKASSYVK